MENASKETHSNKKSLSISGEESAGLTFSLRHSLEDVQAKKETPINYYAAIILITEMWQNISGENLRLLKIENTFDICINIGCICERTLSAMSRVTSVCVLQTAT